jgi:hypothetical protein
MLLGHYQSFGKSIAKLESFRSGFQLVKVEIRRMRGHGNWRVQSGQDRFGGADMIKVPMRVENTANPTSRTPDVFENLLRLGTWINQKSLTRLRTHQHIAICL